MLHAARSSSTSGHGASGLTWSIVTGETPPQSSIPASSSAAKSSVRFGGACTATSGGRISRAHAIVQSSSSSGGSGALGHPRARLRAEVLDDHLLHVAVPACAAAIARSASSRSVARLADPDQDPGRERHARLAGEPQRLEARGRQLVGRAEVRAAAREQPLRRSSRASAPSTRDTGRSSAKSAAVSTPGFRCGSSDVSSSTARAARSRYSSVVSNAERRELVARGAVAQLRLVAEREERLAAAGRARRRARPRAPRRSSCTRARRAAAAARTCSSGRRRGRASSAG